MFCACGGKFLKIFILGCISAIQFWDTGWHIVRVSQVSMGGESSCGDLFTVVFQWGYFCLGCFCFHKGWFIQRSSLIFVHIVLVVFRDVQFDDDTPEIWRTRWRWKKYSNFLGVCLQYIKRSCPLVELGRETRTGVPIDVLWISVVTGPFRVDIIRGFDEMRGDVTSNQLLFVVQSLVRTLMASADLSVDQVGEGSQTQVVSVQVRRFPPNRLSISLSFLEQRSCWCLAPLV